MIDELQTLVSGLLIGERPDGAGKPEKAALSISAGKMPGMLV